MIYFDQNNATGVELIAQERQRQFEKEGYSREHDDKHRAGEIAMAAVCYALPSFVRLNTTGSMRDYLDRFWPWKPDEFKPCPEDRIRELVKAGALIAAEIDRLKRVLNS